jgi:glutathione S-transferase
MFAPVALRFYSYRIETNPEAQAYMVTVLSYPAVKDWIEAGKLETEVIAAFK